MSILIKGAMMPASCEECQSVLGLFSKECPLFKDFPKKFISESELLKHTRHSDCPLVEIPPHGRLIDADKLIENIPVTQNDGSMGCRNCDWLDDTAVEELIDDAPTVIESEVEE